MRRGSCCGTRWGRRLRRGDARRAMGLQRLERGHLRGGGVKDPQRNLPLAIIGGISVIAFLYVFVNAAYFYVLTPTEIAGLSASSSVATEVVARVLGPSAASAMAGVLAMSIFGSLFRSPALSVRASPTQWRVTGYSSATSRGSVRGRAFRFAHSSPRRPGRSSSCCPARSTHSRTTRYSAS